jgi:succinate dehydrogenase (ubiquinone) cytochrome b560 subunit
VCVSCYLNTCTNHTSHIQHTNQIIKGFFVAGYIALTGDLPGALAAFRADHPVLAVPAKLIVAWPLVYHYLGGVRHFVWDLHKIGNNADHTSLLEKDRVEQSSKALFASSLALSAIIALL